MFRPTPQSHAEFHKVRILFPFSSQNAFKPLILFMSLLIKLILLPNIKIRILLKGMNRQPRRGVKHNFIHQTPTKKNPSEKNHHSTTINPNRFTAKTPSQIININNNNSNHINNYPHLKPYKQNRTPQQPHHKNTSIEPNNKHESDSKG